jgi:hypothetical protein
LPKAYHGDKFPRLPKAQERALADNCEGLSPKEHMLMDVKASYFLHCFIYVSRWWHTSWTCWVQLEEQRRPIDFVPSLLSSWLLLLELRMLAMVP